MTARPTGAADTVETLGRPAHEGARARNRMNLIDQLTEAAVASDYESPADRDGSTSRRQRGLIAALGLGLAGFLLAIGVSARILGAPVVAEQRQALRDRIEAADARQEELGEAVVALRAEVELARAAELERITGSAALAETIASFELATGYSAVPTSTPSDAPTPSSVA